jgi:ferredoxin--NADP+ reductase
MCEIVEKEILYENLKRIVVKAPLVANHAQPGQFVIVMADEKGERIPITIADYDREGGTVTLIFLEIGTSTKKLGALEVGGMVLTSPIYMIVISKMVLAP